MCLNAGSHSFFFFFRALKIERFASIIPVIMSLCIHSFSHTPFQFWGKKTSFLCKTETRGLVTCRSLFRLPLSGTIFLLTSDTAVLSQSHSSKLLCLLLPTLSYSNPFIALDAVLDLILILLLASPLAYWRFCLCVCLPVCFGERLGERGEVRGCKIICVCGCACVDGKIERDL